MMAKQKLLVVAPLEMHKLLELRLAPLEADMHFVERSDRGRAINDPFGLQREISFRPPGLDGVLLVAPRRMSPGRAVPSLLIDGVPIAMIHGDRASQLEPWLQALPVVQKQPEQAIWASMAMGKDFYIALGESLLCSMFAGGRRLGMSVEDWMAVRISRSELCRNLARGPNLAVYCGHARARGWSGYQAVRWEHVIEVEPQQPCRVLITLGCQTLSSSRGVTPFGCKWINSGRATAYLAPVSSLKVAAGEQIAHVLGEQLAMMNCRTIGQLIILMENKLRHESSMANAYQEFQAFRLVGNPFQMF